MTFYVIRRIAVGIFLLFLMSAMFFTLTRRYRFPLKDVSNFFMPRCVCASKLWEEFQRGGGWTRRLFRAGIQERQGAESQSTKTGPGPRQELSPRLVIAAEEHIGIMPCSRLDDNGSSRYPNSS